LFTEAPPGAGQPAGQAPPPPPPGDPTQFIDVPFNYDDIPAWVPGPYGPGDQRGALNNINPEKVAKALELARGAAVKTYNLGEQMFNGFPAFITTPPRTYEQRLTVTGYEPGDRFRAEGGILQSTTGLGDNKASVHEERFAASQVGQFPPLATTYQIGCQLDGLGHLGAGELFYNGFRGPEIARGWGLGGLGGETVGPIITRGVLLDVLGVKLARNDRSALGPPAKNGRPVMANNYRITIADIEDAMEFGKIAAVEPGDAVLFRTGWNQLLASRDPDEMKRWNAVAPQGNGLPGIYLAEARYLAARRPAIIASDTWALEVLGNEVNSPAANGGRTILFPVHQDLLMRFGIRIGESYVVDGPAEDKKYLFTFIVTPQYAQGATCGNTPPAALVAI
jgi:kynurenine formamidase